MSAIQNQYNQIFSSNESTVETRIKKLYTAGMGITILVLGILGILQTISGPSLGWSVFGLEIASLTIGTVSVLRNDETSNKMKALQIALLAIISILCMTLGVLTAQGVLSTKVLGWVIIGSGLAIFGLTCCCCCCLGIGFGASALAARKN